MKLKIGLELRFRRDVCDRCVFLITVNDDEYNIRCLSAERLKMAKQGRSYMANAQQCNFYSPKIKTVKL